MGRRDVAGHVLDVRPVDRSLTRIGSGHSETDRSAWAEHLRQLGHERGEVTIGGQAQLLHHAAQLLGHLLGVGLPRILGSVIHSRLRSLGVVSRQV